MRLQNKCGVIFFSQHNARKVHNEYYTKILYIFSTPKEIFSLSLIFQRWLHDKYWVCSTACCLLLYFIQSKFFPPRSLSLSPSHILPKREHVFDCVLNIMLHGNWRRTRNSTDTRQPVAQVLIKLQSDGKTSIEKKSSVRALSEWETEILLHRQHQRPCQSTFRTREEIKRREKNPLMIKNGKKVLRTRRIDGRYSTTTFLDISVLYSFIYFTILFI